MSCWKCWCSKLVVTVGCRSHHVLIVFRDTAADEKKKSAFRMEKFESHRLRLFTSQNGNANSFKVGIEPAAGKSRRHTCTQSASLHVGTLSHPEYCRGHATVKWDYLQNSDTCSPAQGPLFSRWRGNESGVTLKEPAELLCWHCEGLEVTFYWRAKLLV